MSETTSIAASISYLTTFEEGLKFAKEHDEIFEFLVALTVTAIRISSENPAVAQRLSKSINSLYGDLSRVMH